LVDKLESPEYELRILSGVHVGGRHLLKERLLVGTSLECDIILADIGIHGRCASIELDREMWTIALLDSDTQTTSDPVSMKLGELHWINGIALTVTWPNSAWEMGPPNSPNQDAANGPHGKKLDRETRGFAWSKAGARKVRLTRTKARIQSWIPERRSLGTILRRKSALFAVVIFGAILAWHAIPSTLTHATKQVPEVLTQVSSDEIDHIFQRIDGAVLETSFTKTGALLVSGFVADDEQYAILAAAINALAPRPEMTVYVDKEIAVNVRQWWSSEHIQGIQVEYLGSGKFRTAGMTTNSQVIQTLLTTIENRFPMQRGIENRLKTYDEAGEELLRTLWKLGMNGIRGTWQSGRFHIDAGALGAQDLRKLEVELHRLVQSSDGKFPFQVLTATLKDKAFESENAESVSLATNGPLPFEIQSVSGGTVPWLVLTDQTRMLVGGETRGYRLVEISQSHITFDGKARIVIQR